LANMLVVAARPKAANGNKDLTGSAPNIGEEEKNKEGEEKKEKRE